MILLTLWCWNRNIVAEEGPYVAKASAVVL